MTGVSMGKMALRDVIKNSNLIVIAKKGKPIFTEEGIDITPSGERKDDKKYPTFIKATYDFQVVKILLNDTNESIEQGKTIKVYPAYQEFRFEMHQRYYLKGDRKSWLEDYYSPSIKLENEKEPILFLKRASDGNFTFTVIDSFESSALLKRIVAMIKKEK